MPTIGVIADTHGLLRPEAIEALEGSNLLLHAGDAGKPEVLERLRELAPLHAVRGNVDQGRWAASLPERLRLELGAISLLLHHGHLPLPPASLEGARVVVQGHSHRPAIEERPGVLLLNPGSAGPRRFRLPVTVGRLVVEGDRLEAALIELDV